MGPRHLRGGGRRPPLFFQVSSRSPSGRGGYPGRPPSQPEEPSGKGAALPEKPHLDPISQNRLHRRGRIPPGQRPAPVAQIRKRAERLTRTGPAGGGAGRVLAGNIGPAGGNLFAGSAV